MDFIEVIAPIIFLLMFGLGKIFEKVQEQGSKQGSKQSSEGRRPEEGDEPVEEPDVWEAVRRRIEERTVIDSEKPAPPVWLEEDPEPVAKASPLAPPAPPAPPPQPPAPVRRKRVSRSRPAAPAAPKASSNLRDQLDLKDPASLRRAFLYREILGPPVALRRGGEAEF